MSEAGASDSGVPPPESVSGASSDSAHTISTTTHKADTTRPLGLPKPSGLKPPTKIGRLCSNSAPKPAVPISPRSGTTVTIFEDDTKEVNEEQWTKSMTQHSFVALIDIIFTDGLKKYCTGTIIHENVVITAAHCFVSSNKKVLPELSMSFVVIGTKKMFDTGYEHYLPIERILTHSKFNGLTADLSLVFTFVSMTMDKPGSVIKLSGERTTTPVDSNVTVLSWGNFEEDEIEDCVKGVTANIPLRSSIDNSASRYKHNLRKQNEKKQFRKRDTDSNRELLRSRTDTVPKLASRYLTSKENFSEEHSEYEQMNFKPNLEGVDVGVTNVTNGSEKEIKYKTSRSSEEKNTKSFKLLYKNRRRQMGSQQKTLSVEIFGFVNMQTCKKYVERAAPPELETKNDSNDFVCYISDERHITIRDSGAPVIYKGKLVAVTIGGAECDSDYVGIGLKMSCYCSWIANNLPNGNTNLKCCRNCCDIKHEKDSIDLRNHKNIFLRK